MGIENEVKNILSQTLRNCPGLGGIKFEELNEIRLRAGKPVIVKTGADQYFLSKEGPTDDITRGIIIRTEDIAEIMEYATNYSIYAYEEELANGFVTVRGGHRVGVCGKAVMEQGRIKSLRNVSSLNIRVAHEVKGCGNAIFPYILDENKNIFHSLIYSLPGKGKTTLLRDLVRLISNEAAKNVSVVDERFEIGSEYLGTIQKDLGIRTDVISGCPKPAGMEMMLRAMAPQVIAVDELGGERELAAVEKTAFCGVSVLATVHAKDTADLNYMFKKNVFKRYIGLCEEKGRHFAKVFDDKKKLLWEGNL